MHSVDNSPLASGEPFNVSMLVKAVHVPGPTTEVVTHYKIFYLGSIVTFAIKQVRSSEWSTFVDSLDRQLAAPGRYPSASTGVH